MSNASLCRVLLIANYKILTRTLWKRFFSLRHDWKTHYFPKKITLLYIKPNLLKSQNLQSFCACMCVCACSCESVCMCVGMRVRVSSCCRFVMLYKQAWSLCKNRKCQKIKYIIQHFDRKQFFKNVLWIFSVFVCIDQQSIRIESCATTSATTTTIRYETTRNSWNCIKIRNTKTTSKN